MQLSIIIVNWNSSDYLSECIDSIIKSKPKLSYEIIVIDNASFDGSHELVFNRYPMVKFIQGRDNIGFAKANNVAFKSSIGDAILFLNPDTYVQPNAVEILYKTLLENRKAGIVGGRLLNQDGTLQNTSIRAFPTLLNQAFDNELLMKIFKHSSLYGMKPLWSNNKGTFKVDAVSGACLIMKRSTFERVGMFSDEYFMYSEDIDLCQKVNRIGLNIYFASDAVITHYGGGSSGGASSLVSTLAMLESRVKYFNKFYSYRYGVAYKLVCAASYCSRLFILVLMWPFWILNNRNTRIKDSAIRFSRIISWSLGLARTNA